MSQSKIAKILKIFSIFVAIIGAVFFFWYVPCVIKEIAQMENLQSLRWPGTIGMWAIAIICYLALMEFWFICTRIGNDNSFCKENAKSMFKIGIYALLVMVLIFGGMLSLFAMNLMNPATFIIIFFVLFVALGLFIVCYALSKLIENASEIKEENELTI